MEIKMTVFIDDVLSPQADLDISDTIFLWERIFFMNHIRDLATYN